MNRALFDFTHQILSAPENRELALGIFLDSSTAYDCLTYDILHDNLWKSGVRGVALRWIKSYLANRIQRVYVTQENIAYYSNATDISMGIPQGSDIGPLLFVILINDLAQPNKVYTVNYADDLNLLGKSLWTRYFDV